jgi:phosphatidylglycerophosphate synthase
VGVIVFLAAVVLVPLGREYADLRSSHALSRLGALATTSLVLPAFAVSLMLALPLAGFPVAQWLATVATTFLVYSFATRAIVASASPAETAPSRSTRG